MTRYGIRGFSVAAILLSAAILNAQTAPVAAVDEAAPAPAPAPAPVFPKRPAELPPRAPKVTCQGNQITISADNSSLADILAHVKGCTGARIEIPDGAARVRSFEELGPGPVREVLDELLSGTPYNYVIQSSEANPLKVETVLLSMRVASDGKPAAVSEDIEQTTWRKLWQKMQKFDKPDASMVNEDGTLIDPENATAGGEAQMQPAQPVDAPVSPDSSSPGAPAAADVSAATSAPPITPIAPPVVDPRSNVDPSSAIQDRISQMQQLFNQRQQMLQKQGQNPGPAVSPNN